MLNVIFWLSIWCVFLVSLARIRANRYVFIISCNLLSIINLFYIKISISNLPFIILFLLALSVVISLNVLIFNEKIRHERILMPVFDLISKKIIKMSDTEKAALESGDVSWDKELLSGNMNWDELFAIEQSVLSAAEKKFIENQCEVLCQMIDDWHIVHNDKGISKSVWQYLLKEKFFAFNIPKEFGGLGFSAYAHSEIIKKISGRSITVATTVAVPNSLGPAELLLKYGTEEQKNAYLPKLVTGEHIPCFGLTSLHAGSDAASITDTGIIVKNIVDGKEVLGIKLYWSKRYITLAPVATLLGLAVKVLDPDGLLGDKEHLGHTLVLVPTALSGISKGEYHYPSYLPFPNGPISGDGVFVTLDHVIGGVDNIGQGWKMLMECLIEGRALTLPATSTGSVQKACYATQMYVKLRSQFKVPLKDFEGIQLMLVHMFGLFYLQNAIRETTCSVIDGGVQPAVLSAVAKVTTTEMGRIISNLAMDIHGGKAIMLGPKNCLNSSYQGVPIGITVEGSNTLTKSLIIFGQGVFQSHPIAFNLFNELSEKNPKNFEKYAFLFVSGTFANLAKSFCYTVGIEYLMPSKSEHIPKFLQKRIEHASSSYAVLVDICLTLYQGELKKKEILSSRLAYMLQMLYAATSACKMHKENNLSDNNDPILEYAISWTLVEFWLAFDLVLDNLPRYLFPSLLKVLLKPKYSINIKDTLINISAKKINNAYWDKHFLYKNIFIGSNINEDPLALLQAAAKEGEQANAILQKVWGAIKQKKILEVGDFYEKAWQMEVISDAEYGILQEYLKLRDEVLSVDSFAKL